MRGEGEESRNRKRVLGQRREKEKKNHGKTVCADWQKEKPRHCSVAGLWLPKQQWHFYNCQTVSFREDGRNYIFTLPVGRDSNCCRRLNKI